VVFELCERKDKQTNGHTHHNISLPYGGRTVEAANELITMTVIVISDDQKVDILAATRQNPPEQRARFVGSLSFNEVGSANGSGPSYSPSVVQLNLTVTRLVMRDILYSKYGAIRYRMHIIYANKHVSSRRWEPRDGAKSTIVVCTELHAQCDQQSANRALATSAASPPGAVNTRPTAVAVYIALVDGRCAVAKFTQRIASVKRNLYAKNKLDPSNHFDTIPASDRHTDRETRRQLMPVIASTASRR